jgi:DNA-binding NarL/FixJ family response regulator
MSIKVMVVDDQRLFRQSLVALLQQDPEIRVVGQAADGQEAFSVAVDQRPDIVLMDLDLPKLDGAQATRRILERCPNTKILILSVYGDEQHIADGLDAGAAGYILKDADVSEFIHIIKRYAHGLPVASAFVASRPRDENSAAAPDLSKLTRREAEIFDLLAAGCGTKDIASRLGISGETVKVHLQHIYRKLGVKGRVELILSLTSKPPKPLGGS